MDNFQIETAQNISIEQNIAGIGERILAFIVDATIIAAYFIIAMVVMGAVGESSTMIMYMVLGLPALLYFILWESLWNGKTPGKALLQIQVVRKDGSRPSFSNYLVRWLLRIIDISLSSGAVAVVCILFNGKGQRLGDIAAGTTVINLRRKYSISSTLMTEVSKNYVPKYPQVTVLSDKDIQEVKALYTRARSRNEHHIILNLSDRLAEVLDVRFEERPMEFVKRVIDDYNYYTQQ
ncbi:RDD family protein [Christiangramia flava]|uniref:Uncharacterized protein n=1 Tax=Christiangramia flava JLT2011 TaxID=1229726 RepID=A0A1L7I7Q1_9FLAO|nr:RDD family protein [Christiangramia flava]APU69610.1 hypothetical protein GRFL_2886 [Christiangramia flava JLT2011]OSS39359.1 hypothetical protein C723_1905 [Christiangramia flava JLT2011]